MTYERFKYELKKIEIEMLLTVFSKLEKFKDQIDERFTE